MDEMLIIDTKKSGNEIKEIGCKAQNLQLLEQAGFKVPEWICLTDTYCRLLDNRIDKFDFLKNYKNKIHYPVIVRSSSSTEDGAVESNAGQFLSLYNIKTEQELKVAILTCWTSKQNDKSMGVIIQKQLQPLFSGVSFIYKNKDNLKFITEIVLGLGDELVSGRCTPFRVEFDYLEKEYRILKNSKQFVAQLLTTEKNLNPTDDIFLKDKKLRLLNYNNEIMYALMLESVDYWKDIFKILEELQSSCENIFKNFGNSDIEWVYDVENNLYIVQRRPITQDLISLNTYQIVNESTTKNIEGASLIVGGITQGNLEVFDRECNKLYTEIIFADILYPDDFSKIRNVKGIITTEDSLLSHIAILAREYGIPFLGGVEEKCLSYFFGKVVCIDFDNKFIKPIKEIDKENLVNGKEKNLSLDNELYDIYTYKWVSTKNIFKSKLSDKVYSIFFDYYEDLSKQMEDLI